VTLELWFEAFHIAAAAAVFLVGAMILQPLREQARRLARIEQRLSYMEGRLSRPHESPVKWPERAANHDNGDWDH